MDGSWERRTRQAQHEGRFVFAVGLVMIVCLVVITIVAAHHLVQQLPR